MGGLDNGTKVVIVTVGQWEDQRAVVLAIVRYMPTDLILDLIQQHAGFAHPLRSAGLKGYAEVSQT